MNIQEWERTTWWFRWVQSSNAFPFNLSRALRCTTESCLETSLTSSSININMEHLPATPIVLLKSISEVPAVPAVPACEVLVLVCFFCEPFFLISIAAYRRHLSCMLGHGNSCVKRRLQCWALALYVALCILWRSPPFRRGGVGTSSKCDLYKMHLNLPFGMVFSNPCVSIYGFLGDCLSVKILLLYGCFEGQGCCNGSVNCSYRSILEIGPPPSAPKLSA